VETFAARRQRLQSGPIERRQGALELSDIAPVDWTRVPE
jgi:hypothetical protein